MDQEQFNIIKNAIDFTNLREGYVELKYQIELNRDFMEYLNDVKNIPINELWEEFENYE